jgi:hypothetical protein
MPQTTPTVHLNGTSGEMLLEGYKAAAIAVNEALCKLEESAPNARDYYVQGAREFSHAMDEHMLRCHKLTAVREELVGLLHHVQDQIDQRAAQRR